MFSLMRNIGSSDRHLDRRDDPRRSETQVNHAALAEHITPFNHALHGPGIPSIWNLIDDLGLAALNAEVTRQAAIIAYIDDFRLMMFLTLLAVPLLLLIKPPRRATA